MSVLDQSWTRTREINVPACAAQRVCDALATHGFKGRVCQLFKADGYTADGQPNQHWQKIYFDGPPWLFLALHLCFGTARALEFGELLVEAVLEDREAIDTIVRLASDEATWKKGVRMLVSERLERAEVELLEWLEQQ